LKNDDQLRSAEEFLHARIPPTRAMGLRIVANDEAGVAVAAPVALNSNHLDTAFGGSINAVATIAAYALLWLELCDEAADLVIRHSSIRFLRPIRDTISATCARPDAAELTAFKVRLRATGKARIALRVQVRENGALAAELQATFVALRKPAM
jgi:thioesterase domain-containing protein